MPSELPEIGHVAVAVHPRIPAAGPIAKSIAAFFKEHDRRATIGAIGSAALNDRVESGEFDLWICLGGDGSMLRSGHICGPNRLPVLGINLGHLGFLSSVQSDEWAGSLPELLAGNYWLEQRMMLKACHSSGGEAQGTWHVVNEATVGRGETMRPVRLATRVDGHYLTTFTADGLIAATATGSTAYALAAGGPVLPPQMRNILIVPVAPHFSFDRAIVLEAGAQVNITVKTEHSAALSLDGQPSIALRDGDEIDVRASEHSVQFVRLGNSGYFYQNLTSQMNSNYGS
jgi:NAD+ kinase